MTSDRFSHGQVSNREGRIRILPMTSGIVSVLLAFLALTLGGCRMFQPQKNSAAAEDGKPPLPPSLARMQKVYPELESGRFVCLADFNSLPQAALCRVLGPDGTETKAQPEVSVRRSVDATGAGGLRVEFENAQEQLRFDGARSSTLALQRDWSAYKLLMFNVYGPPEGLVLEFGVESGTDVPLRFTRRLFAEPGWHLYKYDIAELGDEIDLTDVRALTWRPLELASPAELYLDDFLLADNTCYALGENAATGEMYLLTSGRRIIVGAKDAFELAFADGVITEWHARGGPNMAVRTGLGPWPTPLPADWYARRENPVVYDDSRLFASWGEQVATHQGVIEASNARIVIEGQWRFLGSSNESNSLGVADAESGANADTLPGHTWRYTIYQTGEVYVSVASIAGAKGWPAERIGYAVALNGRVGFRRIAPEPSAAGPATTFVLLSQEGRDKPDLLWCPSDPGVAERQLQLVSADERHIAVMAGDRTPAERIETAHLLRFLPADMDTGVEGATFALDYQNPATLDVARGQRPLDRPGDLNGDGYNETEGCYELGLENGILRFTLPFEGLLRHFPRFRVDGTADRECWAYCEGRIVPAAGRDAEGRLLFNLPQVIGATTAVEVNSRATDGSSGEKSDR